MAHTATVNTSTSIMVVLKPSLVSIKYGSAGGALTLPLAYYDFLLT